MTSTKLTSSSITEEITMNRVRGEPWLKELQKHAEVFFVGGSVRDELLGKPSKDIDIVVRGLPLENIARLLGPFGKVDLVGKSFGIVKFKPHGSNDEIDIAIPRTERKTGVGHKDFDVSYDHTLPLIKDLERRDFTINAIGKTPDGKIYDPFGGLQDLKNKVIRAVSDSSFSDDPLRMLRAVQFASRFGFTIEPNTMSMIRSHANDIKHISGPRIIIEFEKIVSKGSPKIAAKLLLDTKLYEAIFDRKFRGDLDLFDEVKTMGDFIALLLYGYDDSSELFMKRLKGDKDTAKEIEALQLGLNALPESAGEARYIASRMYLLAPQSLKSNILPTDIKKACRELLFGKYPKGLKELDINGNDLKEFGHYGTAIGKILGKLLRAVYNDEIDNQHHELVKYMTVNM